jgi:anti-sigma B factor antagonist
MKIETRTVGEITILDFSGQITLGEGTKEVRDTVRGILDKGGNKIILNLGGVNYIDSSGVGELVGTFASVTNKGGQLRLVHLTKRIKEMLTITKLLTVFQAFEDEQEAIASFG